MARGRIYVVTDTTNELVTIDTSTQTIAGRLALPGRPTGGSIGPDGSLYITGGDAGQLWPVDPTLAQVGDPIPVGDQPAGVGVSPDGSRVSVADSGDGTLAVVDVA